MANKPAVRTKEVRRVIEVELLDEEDRADLYKRQQAARGKVLRVLARSSEIRGLIGCGNRILVAGRDELLGQLQAARQEIDEALEAAARLPIAS